MQAISSLLLFIERPQGHHDLWVMRIYRVTLCNGGGDKGQPAGPVLLRRDGAIAQDVIRPPSKAAAVGSRATAGKISYFENLL
jgi:hypothetical protein